MTGVEARNGRSITVLQLYPRQMNIYGDSGNALAIRRRLQWGGYEVNLISQDPGDALATGADIVLGGGGQDSGQTTVTTDLLRLGPGIRSMVDDGVPMLMVCGLYQLFGSSFTTVHGDVLRGIDVFDVETVAAPTRSVGNIITTSNRFGSIIGYENHAGRTWLGSSAFPLATVQRGDGNNGLDGTEGVIRRAAIGTYLHGSLLPKNPLIADFLIENAVRRKYGDYDPSEIDETREWAARASALRRPR